MVKQLTSIEEVISELGGPVAVKDLTKRRSASAVPMWKSRRKFPASTYTTLKEALQARGLTAPNELWGMP